MSNANITLVQGLYAAFGRGEIDMIVKAMASDVSWRVVGRQQDYPTLGARKGQAGVQEFFKLVGELQEAREFKPAEFDAVGDKVFVTGRYSWTIRKTGKTAGAEWIHIFTIRGGKVKSFCEFTDTAQFAAAWRS